MASKMMAHAIRSHLPAVHAAGGGQSSQAASHFPLEPFSEPVMSHLVAAGKKKIESQDEKAFSDVASWLGYMASEESNAMSAPIGNDWKHPMSSYYISSSHNTYLSGHQLYGEASELAYTNVLVRGCRCLEIDVWDGESDDSETGTSDEDEDRSASKPSRWGKVKARAARIRSRSRSGSAMTANEGQIPMPTHLQASSAPTKSEHAAPSFPVEPSSTSSKHLSPQPSPSAGPKAEPRVLHGHTLTQSVTFRSVCNAIKDSAFTSTDLPLIVSLEVHASLEQQEVMVKIMQEEWAEFLVGPHYSADISALPPPESLRRKILIKVKWSPNTQTGESNDPVEHVTSNSTDGASESIPTSPGQRKKASKVLSQLSAMGVYTRAYTFKHFSQPEAALPNHVFSLSENKVRNMHSDPTHGPALFEHNRNFLMRVFPRGTRINSSNVDPIFHWGAGAQMVALNWQKLDQAMMLNEGMFAGTGGWALKPEGYRCTASSDNDNDSVEKPLQVKKHHLSLEVRLCAAQRLLLPAEKDISHAHKMKPYVKAQVHVDSRHISAHSQETATDGSSTEEPQSQGGEEKDSSIYKRRSASGRSDCPDFKSETMSWLNMADVIQELSFIRFKIMDDRSMGKDTLLAWACIRLDRLKSGYRFIHLLSSSGGPSPGVLLVHVSKRAE